MVTSRHWMTMVAVAALSVVTACADDRSDEAAPPAGSTNPVESTLESVEVEVTEPTSTEPAGVVPDVEAQVAESFCESMTADELNAVVDRARASSETDVEFESFDESDAHCGYSAIPSGFWSSPGWFRGPDQPPTVGAISFGVEISSAAAVDDESWEQLGYRADPLLDPSVHYQRDTRVYGFEGASSVAFNLWIGGQPIVRFHLNVGDAAGGQSDQDYEPFAVALANELLIELELIPTSDTRSAAESTVLPTWDLVLMGDSVLQPQMALLRQQLEEDLGVEITVHNWINPDISRYSVGGERSADLLERLRTDDQLRQDLADAEVIIFDVPLGMLNDTCASPELPAEQIESCWADIPSVYEADVEAIFEEVVAVKNPADAIIRVTDVWQFRWQSSQSEGIYDIVRPAWQAMNRAVADAASQYDIPLIEAYATFTGIDGERDPVAAGDVNLDEFHLTGQGSAVFVDLVAALGYAPLR